MKQDINKKGYFTLEAAIVLPIFVIGILSIGYCMKIFSTAETITYSMMDETGHLAAQAYGKPVAPGFPAELKQRIREENERIRHIKITEFQYRHSGRGKTDLITVACRYQLDLSLPLRLQDNFEMESKIQCRGFVGKNSRGSPMDFKEMEKNGDASLVCIFPMWGKKFHKETCIYVTNNPRQMVLTAELKKRFKACELCGAERVLTGSYVYCFMRAGTVYHKDSCKIVDKYTIEVEKRDALAKGYIPCSKCGGG